MDSSGKIGKMGEDEACIYLESLGHTILERNWRAARYEVDIISLAPDGIHFVEVKSRTAPVAAEPEENVRGKKRHNIVAAARRYLEMKPQGDSDAWLDVVSVIFEGGKAQVRYIPNAYTPIYY